MMNKDLKRMCGIIRKSLKRVCNEFHKFLKWPLWGQMSFGQNGEDMLLYRVFESQDKGIYVDIGAHHPARFSNTYNLYLRGWHGINIDATPGSMRKFTKHRKRDVNLEYGIAATEGELVFYNFKEMALNTFDEKLAKERIKKGWELKNKQKVKVKRLDTIFGKYLKDTHIDFMSIDIEGMELSALSSNNWNKWRPKYILCEILNGETLKQVEQDAVVEYMEEQGYEVVSWMFNTVMLFDAKVK